MAFLQFAELLKLNRTQPDRRIRLWLPLLFVHLCSSIPLMTRIACVCSDAESAELYISAKFALFWIH